ncbi:lactate utilization protein [Candidatus Parcubacteria bacterium]|nr:lactate utilization protein [Candidatus Parcubacteria bacterium]
MNYTTLASDETLQATVKALEVNNVHAEVVENGAEALSRLKELIPKGASVMNGSSRTLEEVGYIKYLKSGEHEWQNLHEQILAEKDPAKQALLRKQSLLSDYYVGSVHAMAQTGEFVVASNTGSQLPHVVYSSQNPIFVVGAQKVVPTLEDARKRLVEHVVGLEDERMMQAHQMHTKLNKELIFHGESPFTGRTVRVIFVKEKLGF